MIIIQLPKPDATLLRESLLQQTGKTLRPDLPEHKQQELSDIIDSLIIQLQREI